MDRTGADYFAAVQSMRDRLGANAVPIQIPVGQEEHHRGVVDLVEMRAITTSTTSARPRWRSGRSRPSSPSRRGYHHQLIDAIAEHDDKLTRTYLTDESAVTPEMIRRALRKATLADAVTPVLLGSAFKNKGVQPLLDAVIDYLPSPLDVPAIQGLDPKTEASSRARRRRTRRSPRWRSRSCPTRSSASSPTSASTRARSRPATAC